jgi:hypothetical protein
MNRYNSARLYFEMSDFNGWEVATFVENAVFDIIHGRQYGKVAMVGDKPWQEWAAKLASPVKKEGIRYFNLSEKENALRWIGE